MLFFKNVVGTCKKVGSEILITGKNLAVPAVVGFAVVSGSVVSASEAVTLPSVGFQISDYITAGITTMGGVAAVAIGGFAAFMVVKKACKWVGRALG